MPSIDTDYLIIGAGAVGLAFADTLLDQGDADIVIVDRHGMPGGHWNDAYPFVALHQPSAFYGVNSLDLGSNRIDSAGPNSGYYELASGSEVSAYFDKVMRERLLASGRVRYFPMSEYLWSDADLAAGRGRFVSLLSGEETQVEVRLRTVDATYYGTTVPSTHTPKFAREEGVRMVPPNALPGLWRGDAPRPGRFAILGAGKTAMDAAIWLIRCGADPDSIDWVRPRDSWMLDRHIIQPGMEFFDQTVDGQSASMAALAAASDIDDLFLRLEQAGAMTRIDPDVMPGMFHYATISQGEVDVLRRIKSVIRMGHVRSIDKGGMDLYQGRHAMPENTLYVDCTACAVERRPVVPVYRDRTITLQMVRVPQPAFSAALCAFIETRFDNDEDRNRHCLAVPLPDTIDQYPRATYVNMMNQFNWSQDEAIRDWILHSRLDGFGKVAASVSPSDTDRMQKLKTLRKNAMAAMGNLPKLMEGANV